MATEQIQTLQGHWRVTTFFNGDEDGWLFSVDECIHCQFRTQGGDMCSRLAQIAEHEKTHPREAEAREFYKFRKEMHAAAMAEFPYYGLEAFQFGDCEEWEVHFRRYRSGDSQITWQEYLKAVLSGTRAWERLGVDMN